MPSKAAVFVDGQVRCFENPAKDSKAPCSRNIQDSGSPLLVRIPSLARKYLQGKSGGGARRGKSTAGHIVMVGFPAAVGEISRFGTFRILFQTQRYFSR